MSNLNIKRAVENIRTGTTIYTPLVEVVVNAIQAIEESKRNDGRITIRVRRASQLELDQGMPDVDGFEIEDNGIGFTDEHRESFDTLYSDRKISQGGKGFGRFTCLKYFDDVRIRSVCRSDAGTIARNFAMGKEFDIIVDETVSASEATDTGTTVTLAAVKGDRTFDKKLSTLARIIAERLLPYFITDGYISPTVELTEMDGSNGIRLNDFVSNQLSSVIKEVASGRQTFLLGDGTEQFQVRVFKLYSPRTSRSRISLVAHKRDVTGSALHAYVPEFEDEFYEQGGGAGADQDRNYIVRAYVFSPYLDRNVSLERAGFEFGMESNLHHRIGQADIERRVAAIARDAVGLEVTARQEKKRARVQAYVDQEAPWHKALLAKVDLSSMPYTPTSEQIEAHLQQGKFALEVAIKREVEALLAEGKSVKESIAEIVKKIGDSSRNDLIHYIAMRRKLLDIFSRSLQVDESGSYSSEGAVHDIIFPRRTDSEGTTFEDHNLWILDERMNFTNYVSSDVPLDRKGSARPDLLVYNNRVLFRGDNEPSNPVTIFEFKKPQRDDFVNPSSNEDPVEQIIRYVNDIRDGKYKTPEGRKMMVADNTPFYGYVVCDLTSKVEAWLNRTKNFTPMPDRLGWFHWYGNINLYVEVLSWDKVLRDAEMRSKIFFEKLGI